MFDNLTVRKFGHSEIQTFEHLKVGKMKVKNLPHSKILTFEHLKVGKVTVEILTFCNLVLEKITKYRIKAFGGACAFQVEGNRPDNVTGKKLGSRAPRLHET
jgi:hypothetical protein